MAGFGSSLGGFCGNNGLIRTPLPILEVLIHESDGLFPVNIADYKNCRIFRPVIAVVKLQTVLILVWHVLDILKKPKRCVRISMGRKSGIASDLRQFGCRIRNVLVVLSKNGQRFSLETGLGVLKALKTISLEFHHLIKVFLREYCVIDGSVITGVGVCGRPRSL